MKPNLSKEKASVDHFNAKYEVGTSVLVKTDTGEIIETRTRSMAQMLSGQIAVIWLEGFPGCYALHRVKPLHK
jgi:hypothetical protein